MPRKKRSGLALSVTGAERQEISEMAERLGGLSYVKLFLLLVRERRAQMEKDG